MGLFSFYMKALKECRDAGDSSLLVIPMLQSATMTGGEHCFMPSKTGNALANQPLKFQVILLVSKAVKNLSTSDTKHFLATCFLAYYTSARQHSIQVH